MTVCMYFHLLNDYQFFQMISTFVKWFLKYYMVNAKLQRIIIFWIYYQCMFFLIFNYFENGLFVFFCHYPVFTRIFMSSEIRQHYRGWSRSSVKNWAVVFIISFSFEVISVLSFLLFLSLIKVTSGNSHWFFFSFSQLASLPRFVFSRSCKNRKNILYFFGFSGSFGYSWHHWRLM